MRALCDLVLRLACLAFLGIGVLQFVKAGKVYFLLSVALSSLSFQKREGDTLLPRISFVLLDFLLLESRKQVSDPSLFEILRIRT